ncbi:MAG: hypothetical protein AB8I08_00575 [Sandaracinaceae bacterium]
MPWPWSRKKEAAWIWPGVFRVFDGETPVALLVYQGWAEMFWGAHRILPLDDERALDEAFWYPPGAAPEITVEGLWTGHRLATFAAGAAWTETQKASRTIVLRSVQRGLGEADLRLAETRATLRPWLESRLSPDEIDAVLARVAE